MNRLPGIELRPHAGLRSLRQYRAPAKRRRYILGFVFGLVLTVVGTESAHAGSRPVIPLRKGLTVVMAVHDTRGDYESVTQITAINDSLVTIAFDADVPGSGTIKATRPVRRRDLREALAYHNIFTTDDNRQYPGTTALGPSVAVMKSLQHGGKSPFTCYVRVGHSYQKAKGVLKPIGRDSLSVLVNGQPTKLPVVHAQADMDIAKGEFWFLDSPQQPLTLRYRLQRKTPSVYKRLMRKYADNPKALKVLKRTTKAAAYKPETLNVIKIEFPGVHGADPMEKTLQKSGKVDVYGIYFDFNSAKLKPESDAVLQRIASLLKRNAGWKLSIEGHTDSIGAAAYNLELSKRRAAAVKQALVKRYGIAASRLATTGYGETRPKATNATLAGRALNRRVELVRK